MGQVTKDVYTLELVDKILAPLKKIEAQGARVVQTMEKLESLGEKGLGLVKLVPIVGAVLGGLVALKKGVEGVWWALEKSASAAVGFGKAIVGATSFREKWKTLLSHQFGDQEGGEVYKKILKAANVTPGTAADLMENTGRLANVGMSGPNLNAMVGAMASVQAMFDTTSMEKFSRGMTDMFTKAKFEEQDFKQAVSGIIPASAAQEQILRIKGITVAADKVGATFEKLKKHGKITGQEGFLGVLAAFQERIEKGMPIGNFAIERGSNSLEGLLSNLEEAPLNFLRSMDKLDTLPGLRSFKDFIQRVLKFFDLATPQGEKLAGVVERMTNALFGGLDKLDEGVLERLFEGGVRVAERFVEVVKKAWDFVGMLLNPKSDITLGEATGALLKSVGVYLGEGIWEGLKLAMGGGIGKTVAKVEGGLATTAKVLTREPTNALTGLPEPKGKRDLINDAVSQAAEDKYGPAPTLADALTQLVMGRLGSKPTPSAPAMQPLQNVGAAAVDAIAEGAKKRAEQLAAPGGQDESHMDNMIEALRGSAARTGAPVT